MKDFREMSIGEAIAWGIAPGCDLIEHNIAMQERARRSARWERRKGKRSK